jgi:hypothetical protein
MNTNYDTYFDNKFSDRLMNTFLLCALKVLLARRNLNSCSDSIMLGCWSP